MESGIKWAVISEESVENQVENCEFFFRENLTFFFYFAVFPRASFRAPHTFLNIDLNGEKNGD